MPLFPLPDDPLALLPIAQERWNLRHVTDLAETATSRLWRAECPAHGAVVLKILKPYGADEVHGVTLMAALKGQGMVRLLDQADAAILMEDLPGERLGDLVRRGQDSEATDILAGVAAKIRAAPPDRLVPLTRHLRALLDSADFPAERALAEKLLAHAPSVALHGDLHHDNILHSPRGWLAIDAKGLAGDPAFEFANAFRNPFDCQPLARQPERMLALAHAFAQSSGATPIRILTWARVLVATSMLWDRAAGNSTADDEALLPVLSSLTQPV
jgi:streptomycin 6-kinase